MPNLTPTNELMISIAPQNIESSEPLEKEEEKVVSSAIIDTKPPIQKMSKKFLKKGSGIAGGISGANILSEEIVRE